MSLKTIHIAFVTVSTLLGAGFGLWCIFRFSADGALPYAAAAISSFAAAGGLVYYGYRFLKKMEGVSFF